MNFVNAKFTPSNTKIFDISLSEEHN